MIESIFYIHMIGHLNSSCPKSRSSRNAGLIPNVSFLFGERMWKHVETITFVSFYFLLLVLETAMHAVSLYLGWSWPPVRQQVMSWNLQIQRTAGMWKSSASNLDLPKIMKTSLTSSDKLPVLFFGAPCFTWTNSDVSPWPHDPPDVSWLSLQTPGSGLRSLGWIQRTVIWRQTAWHFGNS